MRRGRRYLVVTLLVITLTPLPALWVYAQCSAGWASCVNFRNNDCTLPGCLDALTYWGIPHPDSWRLAAGFALCCTDCPIQVCDFRHVAVDTICNNAWGTYEKDLCCEVLSNLRPEQCCEPLLGGPGCAGGGDGGDDCETDNDCPQSCDYCDNGYCYSDNCGGGGTSPCGDCSGPCGAECDEETGNCYQDPCGGCENGCGDCEYCQGSSCVSDPNCYGPILIDIDGDGYEMTSASNGVSFDMKGDGKPIKLSWTAAGANDAWLALDLNGNGRIDNGTELFGNHTYLPGGGRAGNGFEALAAYDLSQNGGNGDGVIDARDAVYSRLLLWVDRNHNGISEADELSSPAERGLVSISLHYRNAKFVDQYGNIFRYRSRVTDSKGAHFGKWAYDVLLQPEGHGGRPRRKR